MERRLTCFLPLVVLALVSAALPSSAEEGEIGDDEGPKLLVSAPRSSENLPCSKCHQHRPIDRKKRKLELLHGEIVLEHAGKRQWCFDCHEGDKLRLRAGKLIAFEKSYVLCGQCHGTILRDWKVGLHGKRTGRWDGEKLYRQCVSCHDAHKPAFKPLVPMDPPKMPGDITLTEKR